MADLQFLVDYKTLTAANQELNKMGSTAQKSASVFERAFRKVESTNKKALSDVRTKIAFSQRMEAQHRKQYASQRADAVRMNAAYDAEIKAVKQVAANNDRLKNKFVEGHRAMTLYSKELNDISQARKLDIITAEEQVEAVERLNLAMKNGTGAFNSYGNGMVGGTKKQSKLGVVAQQTGYQVGDFLVQIQSGANPMMAFGQQATQLVGVLPLMADSLGMSATKLIGISAALGIVIPLVTAVAGYMLRAKKANDEAAESATELESNIKSLDKTLSDWVNTKKASAMGITVDELVGLGGIEAAEKSVQDLKDKLNNLQETIYTDNLLGKFNKLVTGGYALEEAALEAIATAVDGVKDAEKRLADLRRKQDEDRLKSYNQQYAELEDQLELEQAIASFGADSIQARNVERQNEIDAMERSLNLAVESNEISGQHAKSLFRVFEAIMRNKKASEEYASTMSTLQGQTEMFLSGIEESTEAARKKAEEHLDLVSRLEDEFGEATVTAFRLAGVSWADMEARLSNVADTAGRLASNLAVAASFGNSVGGEFANTPGGLDAFGGGGDYRYDLPSTYRPKTKTKGRSGRKGSSGSGADKKDPLAELTKRIELDTKLLGVSEARAEVMRKLGDDASKYNQDEIDAVVQRLDAYKLEKEALELIQTNQQSIADTLKGSMSDAFMSMVEGTKSFKDAIKDMARAVIKQLFDVLVVQRLVGSFDSKTGKGSGLTGLLMNALPFANGGAFQGGSQIQAFANGGVVGGPTMFPMNGGKTGLMGEAGPEAIMPLKRGANGKLGVEASGGGGATVSQNFYFTANGDESVKRIIQQEAPRIANLTQKQIMDQRRRGGNMKATFG